MTSMWMVQNDDGRYLGWSEEFDTFEFMDNNAGYAFNHDNAVHYIRACGGHLVEMVPAKPKVPVSQEEAGLVEDITDDTSIVPASTIGSYVISHYADAKDWPSEQFRLMEAAINGYTVTEPTKYNVKVPHVEDSVYGKMSDGILTVYDGGSKCDFMQFTMDEIKHYGLEDCERVEIDTEDSDD